MGIFAAAQKNRQKSSVRDRVWTKLMYPVAVLVRCISVPFASFPMLQGVFAEHLYGIMLAWLFRR